jgi:thiamine kinase-like enzyme
MANDKASKSKSRMLELVTPAFSTMHSQINWLHVTLHEQVTLTNWSSLRGKWQKLDTTHVFPFGYYRCKSHLTTYFVKILNENHAKLTKEADVLCQYLAGNGNLTLCLLEEYSCNIHYQTDHASLLCFLYLDSRFFNDSFDDIKLIANSTAQLHNSLALYSQQNNIKLASEQKMSTLISHWHLLLQSKKELEKLPKTAQSILQNNKETCFDVFTQDTQVIHGDLNRGNLLFTANTLYIIDFEDSLSTFSSPLQDIAFIIERFILNQTTFITENIETKIFLFLNEYFTTLNNKASLNRFQQNDNIIVNIIRAISIKSLLILAKQSHQQGFLVHIAEWEKFIENIDYITSNQEQIIKLTTSWFSHYPKIRL